MLVLSNKIKGSSTIVAFRVSALKPPAQFSFPVLNTNGFFCLSLSQWNGVIIMSVLVWLLNIMFVGFIHIEVES